MNLNNQFIFETKGTPDLITDFIDENIDLLKKHIITKKDLQLNIDDSKLKANIKFQFKEGLRYNSNIDFKTFLNIGSCTITQYYPDNNFKLIIKSIIHELTHLYELFQIKNNYNDTKWKRTEMLNLTEYQNSYPKLKYFRDLYYLSLPHEINARVSSLYYYLATMEKNVDIEEELKNTTEYKNYLNLKEFDFKNLYNDIIEDIENNKIGDNEIYAMLNSFNKLMKIKMEINTNKELYIYLKNTKKYFNKIAKNYKQKIYVVLNRAFEERNKIDENIIYCDFSSYNDFKNKYNDKNTLRDIKLNLLAIKDVNYLDFYKK